MLFLTDVDHVNFEKANETRQNTLQSATVSLQVVIGLCKRKETAALKIKAAVLNERVKLSALRRLFSFAVVRQVFNYLQFLPRHYGLQRFQPHRTISFWLWKGYFPIHQLFQTRPF